MALGDNRTGLQLQSLVTADGELRVNEFPGLAR